MPIDPNDLGPGLSPLTVNPRLAAQGQSMRRDFGPREGGAPGMKGLGFFGQLPTQGQPGVTKATELSFDFDIGGKKVYAPLLVPTLSRNEVELLLRGEKPTIGIYVKAQRHAMDRIRQGKSPFAAEGEQGQMPAYRNQSWFSGARG